MPGPVISTGKAWLLGLLIISGVFVVCMFWDPRATYAFLSHVPMLQAAYDWVRELLHSLGW